MAQDKKRELTTLTAGAVARLMEQEPADWGKREHLVCLRYLIVDSIKQAPSMLEAKQRAENEAAKQAKREPNTINMTVAELVNAQLKAVFTAETEWSYASEFKKLLLATGDLTVKSRMDEYAD